MLHITNGDSVVHSFRDGGIPGTYLPWRDVLHDGAVPHRDSLEALSDIRAREIARLGGDVNYDECRAGFAARDAALTAFRDHDEVALWFEHDLYDQLQLLQILDWFSKQDLSGVPLTMIQIGSHPDVTPFYGLGQLTGAHLAALLPTRKPVTRQQLDLGHKAWTAFCAPEPSALRHFALSPMPSAVSASASMPFLQAAMVRWLEEFPSERDRLSRLERELLTAAAAGDATRQSLFLATCRMEPWPWGDNSVYRRIDGLIAARALDVRGDKYTLTDYGRRLLAGDREAVSARTVDVWLGGAHVIIR